jgi:hypothetical protein
MELLHRQCCGLDVHKETVVACLRLVSEGKVKTEVRTFQTTTADLLRLSEWLAVNGCTHVAMEAAGVYWTLEDANIKLDSVLTDVMGKSGRAMIEALIAGETLIPPNWPALPIRGSRRQRRNCVRPFVAG